MILYDETNIIDFPLPNAVQSILDRLDVYIQKYHNNQDEMDIIEIVNFDAILDELDIVSKQYLSAGKLTKSQRDQLLAKYGI